MFEHIKAVFDESLHRDGRIVVVVFYASYCPFCLQFSSYMKKHSSNTLFLFAKADVTDDDSPLWGKYHLATVPTLIAFKDGEEIARKEAPLGVGLDEDDFVTFLSQLVTFT